MNQEVILKIDSKKLKNEFFELLKKIEDDKIKAIGRFLEEEVKPYISIEEFAKLIDEPGYSYETLCKYQRVYRKLFKGNLAQCDISDIDKATIISRIKDKDVQEDFIERARNISRDQLRAEVNEYLEKGDKPTEEVQSSIEMNLKYNGAVLKLISEMRQLKRALYQVRKEKLFDSFSPKQRQKFGSYLSTIKQEYTLLIKEIDENSKYLED
jgi:hypothetical protein